MDRCIYFICFVFVCFQLQGQEISKNVCLTSGEVFTSQSVGSISYSIGEPVVETFSQSNGSVEQGFQQAEYKIASLLEGAEDKSDIKIYPIPSSDFISIEFKDDHNSMQLNLFDVNGKLILSENSKINQTKMDLSTITPGNYILHITDQSNNTIKSVQIIKTQ